MNNLNRFDIVITFYDDIHVELSLNGFLYKFKIGENSKGWLVIRDDIAMSKEVLCLLETEVNIEIINWLKKMLLTDQRQPHHLSYQIYTECIDPNILHLNNFRARLEKIPARKFYKNYCKICNTQHVVDILIGDFNDVLPEHYRSDTNDICEGSGMSGDMLSYEVDR